MVTCAIAVAPPRLSAQPSFIANDGRVKMMYACVGRRCVCGWRGDGVRACVRVGGERWGGARRAVRFGGGGGGAAGGRPTLTMMRGSSARRTPQAIVSQKAASPYIGLSVPLSCAPSGVTCGVELCEGLAPTATNALLRSMPTL